MCMCVCMCECMCVCMFVCFEWGEVGSERMVARYMYLSILPNEPTP